LLAFPPGFDYNFEIGPFFKKGNDCIFQHRFTSRAAVDALCQEKLI
jgi:hypothetical protein